MSILFLVYFFFFSNIVGVTTYKYAHNEFDSNQIPKQVGFLKVDH